MKGKPAKGAIEADSAKSARAKLKGRGVFPTEIFEKSAQKNQKESSIPVPGRGGVKMRNLTMMIRQMATLIKARIPLDEALAALVEQTDDNKLKSIIAQVRTSVNEGKSLADSCRQFPKVFSPIFISMMQVGEASGNLDLVLNRLANFAENQLELRNKVVGALVYPAFMMLAGVTIIVFLFAFAVPKITEVFAGSKMTLPLLTRIMIQISDIVSHYWLTIFLLLFGTYSLFMWYIDTKLGLS